MAELFNDDLKIEGAGAIPKADKLLWLLFFTFLVLLLGRNIFTKPILAILLLIYLPFTYSLLKKPLVLLGNTFSFVMVWMIFAASYFWSVVPKVSLDLILTESAFITLALFITLRHQDDGYADSLRRAAMVHVVIVVLYCLAFPGSSYSNGGLTSLYLQKNNLGAMMAIDTLVLFYTAGRNKWHVLFGFISIALLLASQSKTSISLAAGCGVLIPLVNWWAKSMYIKARHLTIQSVVRAIILGLVIVGLISIVVFRDELLDLLWDNMTKTLFTGRGTLWLTVIKQMRENSLLGIGPGAFWQADGASEIAHTTMYQMDPIWVQHMISADGSYIDLFASIGSVGLALFLLTAVDLYRRLFRHWYRSDSRLIFVLVTFVLLHAVTESTLLYSTNILWLIYLLCYFRVSVTFNSATNSQSKVSQ